MRALCSRTRREILKSLEGARAVQEHLSMPLTEDNLRVVSELMADELNASALTPLLGTFTHPVSLPKRVLKLIGIMTGIALWSEKKFDRVSHCRHRCVSLTFLFALFFHYLHGEPVSGYLDMFAEGTDCLLESIPTFCLLPIGLSGGAFLATVAGTCLPRTSQDAYRSGWKTITYRIAGLMVALVAAVAFLTGGC